MPFVCRPKIEVEENDGFAPCDTIHFRQPIDILPLFELHFPFVMVVNMPNRLDVVFRCWIRFDERKRNFPRILFNPFFSFSCNLLTCVIDWCERLNSIVFFVIFCFCFLPFFFSQENSIKASPKSVRTNVLIEKEEAKTHKVAVLPRAFSRLFALTFVSHHFEWPVCVFLFSGGWQFLCHFLVYVFLFIEIDIIRSCIQSTYMFVPLADCFLRSLYFCFTLLILFCFLLCMSFLCLSCSQHAVVAIYDYARAKFTEPSDFASVCIGKMGQKRKYFRLIFSCVVIIIEHFFDVPIRKHIRTFSTVISDVDPFTEYTTHLCLCTSTFWIGFRIQFNR